MRVRVFVGCALAVASGCTPITARQARVREAGGTVRVPAAAADGAVPELATAALSLPGTRRDVVESALAALDASESGLDCSSFVVRVYAASGVGLPRTVREQIRSGGAVAPAELRPGDLVFFAFARRPADHVGIYAGSGRFVHMSSSARRVQLGDLATPPFAAAWVASRRVLPSTEPDA